MKDNVVRQFLIVSMIEGILALIFLFSVPSMERNAWLFGYSAVRLALGGITFVVLAVLVWISIGLFSQPARSENLLRLVEEFLVADGRLETTCVVLGYILLLGAGLIALFSSPLAGHLGILVAFYTRSLPLLVWLLLLDAQLLLYFNIIYKDALGRANHQHFGHVTGVLLVLVMVTATVFHWALLIFKLKIFWAIPGWFWQFTEKPLQTGDTLFVFLSILVFGCAWFVTNKTRKVNRNLLLLFILGYLLQVVFGLMEGSGFEEIGERFLRSGHKQYALHACDQPDLLDSIRTYDLRFSEDYFLGTKPPGVISFYIITQKLSNFVFPATDYQSCVAGMTRFMAVVFPLLALLPIFPLFWLGRRMAGERSASWAVLLLLVCPNFLLMHLEPDQFLFPFMFVSGISLVGLAMERRSFWWGLLAGMWIYLAVFLSFSLLPLGLLAGLWLVAVLLRSFDLKPLIKPAVGLTAGFALLYLLMLFFLDYNVLARYTHALTSHRVDKEYVGGLAQVLDALLLNNVEFAVWSGLPVVLLYLGSLAVVISRWVRRTPTRLDELAAAFLLMMLALNLMGQTRGEVGRLWIFLMPIVSLMAASILPILTRRSERVFYLVLFLQLVTVFLTFKLQDSIFI